MSNSHGSGQYIVKQIVLISLLWLAASCSQPEQQEFKTKILSFGTYIDVTLADIEPQQARQAIDRIESQLDIMHDNWHAWRPSAITRLNTQLQSGQTFTINPDIRPLVVQSKQLYQNSLGYFNPAIGKLIELWGFYSDEPENNRQLPSDARIKELVTSNPSMDDILLADQTSAKGTNPDLQIDFGGYAKGFGVEQLIEQLQANGIENALINAGGDIKGIGSNHGRPWRIAIEDPQSGQPLGWLELKSGESIFSSGDYIRFFELNGIRYHHIIDPATGYPSIRAHGVTVIAHDAAVADAAATALMVAPKQDWLKIKEKMALSHLLIVDRDGKLYCDKAFADRLHLIGNRHLQLLQ